MIIIAPEQDDPTTKKYPRLGWIIPAIGIAAWGAYDVVSHVWLTGEMPVSTLPYVIAASLFGMLAFTQPEITEEEAVIEDEGVDDSQYWDEEDDYEEANSFFQLSLNGSDLSYYRQGTMTWRMMDED